jgi:REP element-mobilizing transposase RayT
VARRLRDEVAGGTHHAIAKGNAGAAIVADDHDRDAFIRRVGETIRRHEWSCLAYCLLDTHVHLILETPHPNLGAGMKSLLGPYAQNFNWRHEREGHLFRARFYSRRIQSQSHLIAAINYVALNPVRAGLVRRPEQWRWSSYAATIGRRAVPSFLDVGAVLGLVDDDAAKARLRFELGVWDSLAQDQRTAGT